MSTEKMRVSDVYDGFIEAEDIPEGRDVKITIESVRMSGPNDKGKDGKPINKPILKIKGKKKEWVLCKTVAKSIRRQHGNEMNEWAGKEIAIYRTTCNAFGNPKTPCIRVKGEEL